MAKKVTITFKNPVDETNMDHMEVWWKLNSGGTYAQLGTDIAFVTGVADYSVEDTSANVADSANLYYEARAYNAAGSYNSIEANLTISAAGAVEVDFSSNLVNLTKDAGNSEYYVTDAIVSWTSNYGRSNISYTGDFEYVLELELGSDATDTNGLLMGIGTSATNGAYNGGTWEVHVINNNAVIGVGVDGTAEAIDVAKTATYAAGDELVLKRVGSTITLIFRDTGGDTTLHTFSTPSGGALSGAVYLRIANGKNRKIVNPLITQ